MMERLAKKSPANELGGPSSWVNKGLQPLIQRSGRPLEGNERSTQNCIQLRMHCIG